jgi:hypothetical protein
MAAILLIMTIWLIVYGISLVRSGGLPSSQLRTATSRATLITAILMAAACIVWIGSVSPSGYDPVYSEHSRVAVKAVYAVFDWLSIAVMIVLFAGQVTNYTKPILIAIPLLSWVD